MTPTISSTVKYALVAALAAAGMYWFDPEQGRRRRAVVRDKLVSGLTETRHATGVGRDARHRLHGAAARTHSLIRASDVSDEVLVERVRSALGRATSHPGAIDVSCSQGVVILRGAVLKHEHPRVMRAARSAAGASEVHDELAAYKRPDGVSALQGGGYWSPTARMLACSSGASLAMWSLRQPPLIAFLATAIGSALMIRGASNMTLKQFVGGARRRTIEMQKTSIDAPVETGVPAAPREGSRQEPWQSRTHTAAETRPSEEPGAVASP